jgi:hypothetical protein
MLSGGETTYLEANVGGSVSDSGLLNQKTSKSAGAKKRRWRAKFLDELVRREKSSSSLSIDQPAPQSNQPVLKQSPDDIIGDGYERDNDDDESEQDGTSAAAAAVNSENKDGENTSDDSDARSDKAIYTAEPPTVNRLMKLKAAGEEDEGFGISKRFMSANRKPPAAGKLAARSATVPTFDRIAAPSAAATNAPFQQSLQTPPTFPRPNDSQQGSISRTEFKSLVSMPQRLPKPPVFCNCADHYRNVLLDRVFSIPLAELVMLIHADTEASFLRRVMRQQGFQAIKVGEWRRPNERHLESRQLEYSVPLRIPFCTL